MSANFVVISGCSGGGKSTLLAELEARGFAVVPEPGRRIVADELAGGGHALPWVDMAGFARRAMALALEDRARMAGETGLVFFDRGLVDAAVALGTDEAMAQAGLHRYHDQVFMTPPWPEIFVTDGERRHGFEDSVAEYDRLCGVYPQLGYQIREIGRMGVGARADFVLDALGHY
ncbi:AAA family ATPase [Pelagibacterium sp.]|uniref:AAA family ATPase n=1 Tax=Pelagibacterium sp. TaxID=1967288 RepID=UPI003A94AE80